jgi:hypothetical protein
MVLEPPIAARALVWRRRSGDGKKSMFRSPSVLAVSLSLCAALWTFDRGVRGFALGTTEGGNLTRWRAEYILLTVDPSVEAIMPTESVAAVFRSALSDWIENADLPLFVICETRACGRAYSSAGANENCIYAASEASDDGAPDVGGTARVTYLEETGEIVDVDIALSTSAGPWSLAASAGTLSMRAVALHEIGHLLGLEHSEFQVAAMYSMTSVGEAQHDALADDDIRGARALYDEGKLEEYGCGAATLCGEPGCHPTALLEALFGG